MNDVGIIIDCYLAEVVNMEQDAMKFLYLREEESKEEYNSDGC